MLYHCRLEALHTRLHLPYRQQVTNGVSLLFGGHQVRRLINKSLPRIPVSSPSLHLGSSQEGQAAAEGFPRILPARAGEADPRTEVQFGSNSSASFYASAFQVLPGGLSATIASLKFQRTASPLLLRCICESEVIGYGYSARIVAPLLHFGDGKWKSPITLAVTNILPKKRKRE
jgi:hypothetical protein